MTQLSLHRNREHVEPQHAAAREENEQRSAWLHEWNTVWFVCECSDHVCPDQIPLNRSQYEELRTSGTRFGVAASAKHVGPSSDRVVARHEHHWIVESATS